jgi:hypothetical protein
MDQRGRDGNWGVRALHSCRSQRFGVPVQSVTRAYHFRRLEGCAFALSVGTEIGSLNSVRNLSLRCLFDCGAVGWISRACVRLCDNRDLNFEQCCLKFGQTVELALRVLCFVDIRGFHYFYWFSSYWLI